jgi:hypothetical protein
VQEFKLTYVEVIITGQVVELVQVMVYLVVQVELVVEAEVLLQELKMEVDVVVLLVDQQ